MNRLESLHNPRKNDITAFKAIRNANKDIPSLNSINNPFVPTFKTVKSDLSTMTEYDLCRHLQTLSRSHDRGDIPTFEYHRKRQEVRQALKNMKGGE